MKIPLAKLVLSLAVIVSMGACKRKEYNPLLGTPDPTTSDVQMYVRGVDNTQPPTVAVLFQSVANASVRMRDLSLGNFAVLQDGVPLIPTTYSEASSYPFAVMLVIDRSGSMDTSFAGSTRTVAANDAASYFLQHVLPESAQAGLVEFDNGVQLTVGMTSDKASVAAAINSSTFGGGGTALYDAIVRGAQELSKATGLRLLIVLTDGADNSSSHTPAQTAAALQAIGTVANGVIIGGDVTDTSKMRSIILPTGGKVTTSMDPAQLKADLNATLHSGYFDDIYALTFRRRNNEPNIKIYVSYGSISSSVDLSVYR